ncbi:hypothetical protein [Agrobacterium pusense]|uniref:hypothetical protein n=1 Tax=Agrobacterium pusense TaxID=648995 RepID=UPI0010AE1951|nr:hypothetical protein [Agrobacterium pusense]WCK26665.1 hypothetical protein CFBP5496_0020915 [Agrobacterium pusense]
MSNTPETLQVSASASCDIEVRWAIPADYDPFEHVRPKVEAKIEEINSVIPEDTQDPVLAERRACAIKALQRMAPHYMSMSTAIDIADAIMRRSHEP